jgi:PAS domain S-box-containing protein
VRKDGSSVWVNVTVTLKRDSRGRPQHFIAIADDITVRKAAEEALRESEERFRATFEQAAVGVVHTDITGRYLRSNKKFCDFLGYSQQELVKVHFLDITHPEDRARDLAHYQKMLARKIKSYTVDKRYRHKDGSFVWANVTVNPVCDESGRPQYFISIIQDITERKRAEEALALKAQELARSNADLEQFAYVASHDLQEPLRSIAGYTQLLSRRYKGRLDADADQFIAYAVEGATRLQQLITDLLTYSRVDSRAGAPGRVRCDQVLARVRSNLHQMVKEHRAEISSDRLPAVWGDASQLEQLFQNLIANGIKFRQNRRPPRVHVSAARLGEDWLFSVRDNGIGIRRKYFNRLFVIFQRLHSQEEYPGTGIGLALCKKIVERHGGRIWVESKFGKGSTFYYTIPAKEKTAL